MIVMKDNNITINVLIVEDEIHAQEELCRLLSNSPYNIKILETIDNIDDTVDWINNNPSPHLMFFDIQLSDGLSFEILKETKISAPIIFTTAYDEYAIKAFKVNSIDYLLKPLKQNELNSALQKFESLNKQNNTDFVIDMETIAKLLSNNKQDFKKRFMAKLGDQIYHISIDEISYFKAEDNEVMLITTDNNRYFIDYSLDQITSLVDPELFHRINRSYITHISSIKKISKYFNSRLTIELHPIAGENVIISRAKVSKFLKWIDK